MKHIFGKIRIWVFSKKITKISLFIPKIKIFGIFLEIRAWDYAEFLHETILYSKNYAFLGKI